jgi:PAS domain S-box-containing protein
MLEEPARVAEEDYGESLGGVWRDVLETSASHLERDLKASGITFSKGTAPMWVFDQSSLRFLAVNEAAVKAYGYSRSQFLAMTILDIRPSEDIGPLLRHALHPHEVTGDIERWRHLTRDGKLMNVWISGRPLMFELRRAQLIIVHRMVSAEGTEAGTSAT